MNRKNQKRPPFILELLFTVFAGTILLFFVYLLVTVSFQEGGSSSELTQILSRNLAYRILEDPTEAQIDTMNYVLRFFAHLVLFFILGYGICYVSMLFFRGYFRVIGILISVGIVWGFAYYTEYYKQFVAGRHFQMRDVKLNWIGGLTGIMFMVLSYFMHKILIRISDR